MLCKKGYKKQNRSLQAYDLIQNLERLGDEYKFLCDSLSKRKTAVKKEFVELLREVNEYYNLFYHLFLKFDSEKKTKLTKMKRSLDEKTTKLLGNDKEPVLT